MKYTKDSQIFLCAGALLPIELTCVFLVPCSPQLQKKNISLWRLRSVLLCADGFIPNWLSHHVLFPILTFAHHCFLWQVNHPVHHVECTEGYREQDPCVLVNFAGSTHPSSGWLRAWRLLWLQFIPHHLDTLQFGPQQMLQRCGAGSRLARRPCHYIRCGSCRQRCASHQLSWGGHAEQAPRLRAGTGEGGGAAIGPAGLRPQRSSSSESWNVGDGLGFLLTARLLMCDVIPLSQGTIGIRNLL